MRVRISSEVQDAILREAAASPDSEVCGLLLGRACAQCPEAVVTNIEPCRNVALDPVCAFEIDSAQLLAAHRAARAGGPAILGHYHSHPFGPPWPSPRDAAAAADDGAIWLIAGKGHLTAWRAVTGGALHGRFAPLRIDTGGDGCAADSAPPQANP